MSYMLWQLIRDVYQNLGRSEIGTASGGTTTTLVDGSLAGRGRDDAYNRGTVLIFSADGEAPEGEIRQVADYEGSTGTFTFENAMNAAPAAGDLYLRVDPYFPYRSIIEQVNTALVKLGEITLVDSSTLETAENQTEYAAAVTWKRRPPLRVDLQNQPDTANDNRWETIHWWEYVPAAAGAEGRIVFDRPLPGGRKLRVWYIASHPRVSAFDDEINELIHPALAAAATTVEALTWQNARISGSSKALSGQLEAAKADLEQIKRLYPTWKPVRQSRMRLAGLGRAR